MYTSKSSLVHVYIEKSPSTPWPCQTTDGNETTRDSPDGSRPKVATDSIGQTNV
jgi:hypothetical protein